MNKRYFFVLLLLLFSLSSSFAKTKTRHYLTFMGTPLNGPLSAFVENMKAKDLQVVDSDKSRALLIGSFSGYRDCTIFVETINENTDVVCNATVFIPVPQYWSNIESAYSILKSGLTNKYFEPDSVRENLPEYSRNDNDMKLYSIQHGDGVYESYFDPVHGDITLAVVYNEEAQEFFIRVSYFDSYNMSKREFSNNGDL